MKRLRRGLTTTQVLTVIVLTIIALGLFTVGAPLLLFMREHGRRLQCKNNLIQYGLGIHTYHDMWNKLPSGAKSVRGMGPSFQVAILPQMEQQPLFDTFRYSGDAIGDATQNAFVAQFGDGIALPYAHCPSSPHSVFVKIEAPDGKVVRHQVSSYVGIAGADSFAPSAGPAYQAEFTTCCGDLSPGLPQQGIMAINGALVPNSNFNFGAIRDGTSNTIFMSEQAGWGRGQGGSMRFDASSPHGWIAGTAEEKQAAQLLGDQGKSITSSVYNLTTIVYQPGSREADRPGISAGHGPNTPLTSGHWGSFNTLRGDGSVHQVPYFIDLIVLKKLAVRNDGQSLD